MCFFARNFSRFSYRLWSVHRGYAISIETFPVTLLLTPSVAATIVDDRIFQSTSCFNTCVVLTLRWKTVHGFYTQWVFITSHFPNKHLRTTQSNTNEITQGRSRMVGRRSGWWDTRVKSLPGAGGPKSDPINKCRAVIHAQLILRVYLFRFFHLSSHPRSIAIGAKRQTTDPCTIYPLPISRNLVKSI